MHGTTGCMVYVFCKNSLNVNLKMFYFHFALGAF